MNSGVTQGFTQGVSEQNSYFQRMKVNVDGFEGQFSKFSYGFSFALHEIDLTDNPKISLIGNYVNKRAQLTDSIGQHYFEQEVRKDVLERKILQGYYLSIQKMIQNKQDKCFLAINDGNYCTYSEYDSQFFRIKEFQNSEHLIRKIDQDEDSYELPFSSYTRISYKSRMQEQYVYELTLQEFDQNFIDEIEYQLKKLTKCEDNGKNDGPWDQYTSDQKQILYQYRFNHPDQIHNQNSSDSVVFLQSGNLGGFKRSVNHHSLTSNYVLFREGKSLLKYSILNNKIDFTTVCLNKIAEKDWKFRLIYDDMITLITDKKIDFDLKMNTLNSIFLLSTVVVQGRSSNSDVDYMKFNISPDENSQKSLPNSYGILNLTFMMFQDIIFGCRNMKIISDLSKYLYQQKLIQNPMYETQQQELYKDEIIWLADSKKRTYSKTRIDQIPNMFDDGYSNYSQMREFMNLKQLEHKINYYTCAFKIYEQPFHDESIKFMVLLRDTEQVEIFDTDIKYIINFRWKQAYVFIMINSFVQIIFACCMTLHLSLSRYHQNHHNNFIQQLVGGITLILAVFLLIRDLIMLCYNFYKKQQKIMEYQKVQFGQIYQFYNIIIQIAQFPFYLLAFYLGDIDEILNFVSQAGYIIYYIQTHSPNAEIQISQGDKDLLNILHLAAITASATKALFVIFRLFERVRYMVFMIKKVITDMIPFTIIFISTIVLFGIVFLKLSEIDAGFQSNNDNLFYIDATNLIYGIRGSIDILLLGGEQVQETRTGWFMNLMGFMIIQVIMLNLIIAVISDTYASIQSVKNSSAMKSQITLMIDSLKIPNAIYNTFYKGIFRVSDRMIYINFCRYPKKNFEKDDSDYCSQMTALKSQIKKLKTKLKQEIQISNERETKQINQRIDDLRAFICKRMDYNEIRSENFIENGLNEMKQDMSQISESQRIYHRLKTHNTTNEQ